MAGTLMWKGAQLEAKVAAASKAAVDETMAQAIQVAKPATPVDTGTAQGSIRMQPAVIEGSLTRGRWGSFDVNYFIFLEIGTYKMPAFRPLRIGADAEYWKLAERIKARLR